MRLVNLDGSMAQPAQPSQAAQPRSPSMATILLSSEDEGQQVPGVPGVPGGPRPWHQNAPTSRHGNGISWHIISYILRHSPDILRRSPTFSDIHPDLSKSSSRNRKCFDVKKAELLENWCAMHLIQPKFKKMIVFSCFLRGVVFCMGKATPKTQAIHLSCPFTCSIREERSNVWRAVLEVSICIHLLQLQHTYCQIAATNEFFGQVCCKMGPQIVCPNPWSSGLSGLP